jgi:hypothetical protein
VYTGLLQPDRLGIRVLIILLSTDLQELKSTKSAISKQSTVFHTQIQSGIVVHNRLKTACSLMFVRLVVS